MKVLRKSACGIDYECNVQLSHPTLESHSGRFRMVVQSDDDGFCVKSTEFGWSRQYPAHSPNDAVRLFAAEHGCEVVGFE